MNVDESAADPAALRSWLFAEARRAVIERARARRARPPEAGSDDAASIPPIAEDAIDRVLIAQVMREAMANLSAARRRVLVEIYFRSQSPAAAAAALGVPEGALKSRAYDALCALREAIGDLYAEGVVDDLLKPRVAGSRRDDLPTSLRPGSPRRSRQFPNH